ncbi:FAD-dependent monooxygenase [Variovorax sp. OV329]|uniref:FAD-dependent monooxygenase n=1 Tax=Variovorax sp. OV329 TaxID=1882825 RepID=UPI0008E93A3D|nr:FAD-dependent monooxygenase [Variovorax sp. OV329]SFM92481.1 putative polyketide hydroxylase [Variovorax sp. OV329]
MTTPSSSHTPIDVPVLIVGGGPVGLTASIHLSRAGVRSLLVEKHAGTATLPKARSINARTMEMYRQLGIENEIRAAGLDPRFSRMVLWATSLAGEEVRRLVPGSASAETRSVSPTTNASCAQDLLEPILRRHAQAGAPDGVRFGVSMQDLRYGADGARGLLVDSGTGQATPFRARYVIAADGSQSTIRRQIGAQMLGERDIYDSINVHFRADLRRFVEHRPAALYMIEQPDLRGTFLTINGSDRWSFLVNSMSLYGFTAEQFTPEFAKQTIRTAIGQDDVDIDVLGIGAWRASAIVSDRYRDGPVFLAGDSAHEMPPTGGMGLNTGVQDAHNLAWKLAAVIKGEAGEELLDTYHAERRPMGEFTTRTALLSSLSMGRKERTDKPVTAREEFLQERGVIFGYRYESTAVIPDPDTPVPQVADPVTQYVPSATPGCRAPHAELLRSGEKVSTIELFGLEFVLLAGPQGKAWKDAADAVRGPSIRAHVVGDDLVDADGDWQALYGVGPQGAVLVRPDGIVAWRSEGAAANAPAALDAVLQKVLSRHSTTVGAPSATQPAAQATLQKS